MYSETIFWGLWSWLWVSSTYRSCFSGDTCKTSSQRAKAKQNPRVQTGLVWTGSPAHLKQVGWKNWPGLVSTGTGSNKHYVLSNVHSNSVEDISQDSLYYTALVSWARQPGHSTDCSRQQNKHPSSGLLGTHTLSSVQVKGITTTVTKPTNLSKRDVGLFLLTKWQSSTTHPATHPPTRP